MDFSKRAKCAELLDKPGIPRQDIERNLHELAIINKWLGGHRITVSGFSALKDSKNQISICEIGCGGGDNLKAIEDKSKQTLSISGIDINADCIRVAENREWKNATSFCTSDFRKVNFDSHPDIIFNALFCHHFDDIELEKMFQWMRDNCKLGFFINDLHRHPLAYFFIRLLTSLFSKSYLVKYDAPLSVKRGFTKKELQNILAKAGITNYSIRWKWAFRWLIIVPA